MKLLADLHIAPRTVAFLNALGHQTIRVPEVLPANAPDALIVEFALREGWTILTQDLDFSDLIALSGRAGPSLISLRLSSSRVEHVNNVLGALLPAIEADVARGTIVAVRDTTIRRRYLPIEHAGA